MKVRQRVSQRRQQRKRKKLQKKLKLQRLEMKQPHLKNLKNKLRRQPLMILLRLMPHLNLYNLVMKILPHQLSDALYSLIHIL
ncbi:unnamed protein product [Trichobilharzia regenti]|nr:unnamed protein product [Trichobilharzia regenti]